MAKLHPKLERDAARPQYILTETSVGYRLSTVGGIIMTTLDPSLNTSLLRRRLLASAAGLLPLASHAQATWPNKPIRLVVRGQGQQARRRGQQPAAQQTCVQGWVKVRHHYSAKSR